MARRMWAGGAAVILAAAGSGLMATGAVGGVQAPRQLAVVPTGRVAMEVVGQSLQDGNLLTSVGYVTHLAGVSDAQLFSDPAIRDEKHARLVFSDQSTVASRSVLQTLFVLTFRGTTTLRWQAKPSSDFANPASFAAGRAVGTFGTRVHDVINVLAPDSGIATAVEQLTQTRSGLIPLPGRPGRLGRVGVHLRLESTGAASRSSVSPVRSATVFSGVAVSTE